MTNVDSFLTTKMSEILIDDEDVDDHVEHYGIKGMKWGVRRDRRTLDRLAGRDTHRTRKQAQRARTKAIKVDRRTISRQRRQLTTKDLEARIRRLELEKKLKDLSDRDSNTSKVYLQNAIKTIGKEVLKPVATTAARGTASFLLRQTILRNGGIELDRDVKFKELADFVVPKPKKK